MSAVPSITDLIALLALWSNIDKARCQAIAESRGRIILPPGKATFLRLCERLCEFSLGSPSTKVNAGTFLL